jgi:hypothetical protein
VRIHVGKAGLVPDLIRYFEQQSDCVVLQVGVTELEVSLLGSYRHERHDLAVKRLLADYWRQSDGPVDPHTTNGHH